MNGGKLNLARRKDYFIGIGLGLLMAAHWVSYFAAMQYSSVSVGMIALFTFPVITVLIEPFFEGIRLVWQDILSAVVVLFGIFLIVPEVSIDNDVTLGIVVGIGSAVLYALRNLCHILSTAGHLFHSGSPCAYRHEFTAPTGKNLFSGRLYATLIWGDFGDIGTRWTA